MKRAGNERTGNKVIHIPVAESTILIEGTIAAINSDGYAVTASKAEGLTIAGCVQKHCDNSGGAAGDIEVEVKRGAFVWDNDGTIKNTDILKPCYISNSHTVTLTADGSSFAGIVLAVEADGVIVDMMITQVPAVTSGE